MVYYAGIGSRRTPVEFLDMFVQASAYMSRLRYVLRSGGADGADLAFERGAGAKEVYLPWVGFNGSSSGLLPLPEAFRVAEKYHPRWNYLNQGSKKLMARNVHQVLGRDLNTPSSFIVCWTPCGSGSGGTGQALRIARDYGIPVFDCGRFGSVAECVPELRKFMDSFRGVPLEEAIKG